MQSTDRSSELTALRNQLQKASATFDEAVKKDVTLGELKVVFHQMKVLKTQLEELEQNQKIQSKSF